MPREKAQLSDLVRDSKLQTTFFETYVQHVFHDSGRSAGERRLRREERWTRLRFLGQGTYGMVYLERCTDNGSDRLRAVKEVKKSVVSGQDLDYNQELEAVMKFSHPNVRAHALLLAKNQES